LSWVPGDREPRFLPVSVVTRREFDGEMIEVRTEAGHSLRCTADHPFLAYEPGADEPLIKLARQLGDADHLPILEREPAGRERTAVLAPPRIVEMRELAHSLDGVTVRQARVVESTRSRAAEPVYSLEVPGPHTFVTADGLVISNCFPKDVSALKQLAGNTGYHFQLLTAVIEVNELQKRRTISKLKKHLGSLVGKDIALLGVAFKPDTDDIREATSLVLAGRLQGEGANVRAYDPVAGQRAAGVLGAGVEICDSAMDALRGADGAVLVTEWSEFKDLDWANDVKHAMKTPLIVDGRNYLDREALIAAGFDYEGVGR
jgi:UDP-glucose/GDP-mannose dehydrogenase family protein